MYIHITFLDKVVVKVRVWVKVFTVINAVRVSCCCVFFVPPSVFGVKRVLVCEYVALPEARQHD